MLALLFALLAPLVWSVMNIIDKYVISAHTKKVRHALGFALVAMVLNGVFGLIIASFLDWSIVTLHDVLFPAIAGAFMGLQFVLYYWILRKEDVSSMVGLSYAYPLLIALLSFIFLGERLSVLGYAGTVLVVAGVFVLSLREKKIKFKVGAWIIIGMVFTIAFNEFFIKLATSELPLAHGIAIDGMVIALVALPFLLYKSNFWYFFDELHNAGWAVITESFTLGAIACTFVAMDGLPATVVSSIGAAQPLIVLGFERAISSKFGSFSRDHLLLPKLGGISLIVAGVVVLYLTTPFL